MGQISFDKIYSFQNFSCYFKNIFCWVFKLLFWDVKLNLLKLIRDWQGEKLWKNRLCAEKVWNRYLLIVGKKKFGSFALHFRLLLFWILLYHRNLFLEIFFGVEKVKLHKIETDDCYHYFFSFLLQNFFFHHFLA